MWDEAVEHMYIIDAMAIAHRCYWVHKDLKTSDGKLTGLVYGAKSFIESLARDFNPTRMVVAAESESKCFRYDIYPDYKKNRKDKDPEFLAQLPDFFKMFELMGVPVISKEGYEADDVIGTLSRKYADKSCWVNIVSGDKDFMQLVNENITLLRPLKFPEIDIVTPEVVKEKLGINADQVVDYLAIVGDSADNIPGVKGIGPKGAQKLLSQYKDLKNIYGNLPRIGGKNYEKLAKSASHAEMSKNLATIDCSIELEEARFDDMSFSNDDLSRPELIDFYKSLEFNIKL